VAGGVVTLGNKDLAVFAVLCGREDIADLQELLLHWSKQSLFNDEVSFSK